MATEGQDELSLLREIYGILTKTYKLRLDAQDTLGRTVLHVAAAEKNVKFLDFCLADIGKESVRVLNIQEKRTKATFLGVAL